jgi:DsbC/DsbD-like thiol-disulfide interchange protein
MTPTQRQVPRKLWQSAVIALAFAPVFAFLLLPLSVAQAGESAPYAKEKLRLIGAADIATHVYTAGIEMTLAPGWHTYWRKPGDSGIAPRFDWSGSDNVADIQLLWPVPERFDLPDDLTVGYTSHIVWPVLVRPADPSRGVTLRLHMNYGVCLDICVPGDAHLALDLPTQASGADGALIRAALQRVPAAPQAGQDVTAKLNGDTLRVTLSGVDETPALILEGPKAIWFGKPLVKRVGETIIYDVPLENSTDTSLAGQNITATFSGPATAIEATRKVK